MTPNEIRFEWAFFAICAVIAVAGAIGTVAFPNPIRGALSLLFCILAVAGMYLQLHAPFLASIQLIVYAGAVVVLFLFVIMLIGPEAVPPKDSRAFVSRLIGGIAASAVAIQIVIVLWIAAGTTLTKFGDATAKLHGTGSGGAFDAVTQELAVTDDGRTVRWTVPLANLQSGNPARDAQWKERAQIEKFPSATFEVAREDLRLPGKGQSLDSEVTGKLTLHGISQPAKATYSAKRGEQESYAFTASIGFDPKSHGLEQPELLGTKVTYDLKFQIYRKAKIPIPVAQSGFGTVEAFGAQLFSEYLVPFEVASFLLMVAVVGALAVGRGKQPDPQLQKPDAIAPAEKEAA